MQLNSSQNLSALYKRLIDRSTQAKLIPTEWLDNQQLELTIQMWPIDRSKRTNDILTLLTNQVNNQSLIFDVIQLFETEADYYTGFGNIQQSHSMSHNLLPYCSQ